MEQNSIELPAVWNSIERLIAFTDAIEGGLELSAEQGYLLRLVVEEIATNIVKYGYLDLPPGVMQLTCRCENGTLQIIFRDHGHPFDPNACPEPDLNEDVDSRTIGGLGVFLVREFADHMSYHHDATSGWNELVVVKGR